MCGFVACVGLNGYTLRQEQLVRMTGAVRHRGPDDEGYFRSNGIAFGFRRLSIQDLTSHGHQPMTSSDDRATIVFNGEIYNFLEIRDELESKGHQFSSRSDTEVLLHAYLEWGQDCLTRLNGMWAFVVFDHLKQQVFGARDRFGIKPLFRFNGDAAVIFSSEIKSILESDLYQIGINRKTAARFLVEQRLDEGPDTFYENIVSVPPATAFTLDSDGRYDAWTYWSFHQKVASSANCPARRYGEIFEDAIRLHMRSDVPVAVHLSGGMDSSSIICASARIRGAIQARGPLMAFSYMAPEFDESRYISDTLAQCGSILHRLEKSPTELWNSLGDVLYHQDEPVHSMTALVGFELMRLTAQTGIKVILNGQGADETIGGYPSYFWNYWHTLVTGGRVRMALAEISAYCDVHGIRRSTILAKVLKAVVQSKLSHLLPYRELARRMHQVRRGRSTWYAPEFISQIADEHSAAHHTLEAALTSSVCTTPLPLYLRVEDRNSMAHSVEARVPFLDYRLVEYVGGLPAEWHLRGGWNKFVLREAMAGRIPESVRIRVDKLGFPTPTRDWVAGPLYEPIRDILSSRACRERGIYDHTKLCASMEAHRLGSIDVGAHLFDVAQYEIWNQQVITRK